MNKTISIKKSISFGWNEFWARPWFWILAYAIVIGVSFKASSMMDSFKEKNMEGNNGQNQTLNYKYTGEYPANLNLEMPEVTTNENGEVEITNEELLNQLNEQLNQNPNELGNKGIGIANQIMEKQNNENKTGMGWIVGIILMILVGLPIIIALGLLTYIANQILAMGYVHLNLDAVRGKKLDYKTLLSDVDVKKTFKILGASIIYVVIVFLGLFLLVVPGIYFGVKYFWAHYFIVDKNAGIREAFKLSAQASKGIKLKTLGLMIILALLNFAGMLVLFIGLIPTGIMSALAIADAYNDISNTTIEKDTK